jgi:multicomponent Na+:H+ antiporter subunit C
MESHQLYALTGALLFCVGLYGLVACRHLLRKVMALNISGGGVFLFLIAVAKRNLLEYADPVLHAMVLTGIVVALSATGFAIALVRRIFEQTRQTTLDEERGEQSDA